MSKHSRIRHIKHDLLSMLGHLHHLTRELEGLVLGSTPWDVRDNLLHAKTHLTIALDRIRAIESEIEVDA